MDWITDGILYLSRLCRDNLGVIAMALTAVTVVYAGKTLSAWSSGWLGRLHGVLRIPARAVLNLALFGAIFYFIPNLLTSLLGYFNNYTLSPVLLVVMICVGILADRYGR